MPATPGCAGMSRDDPSAVAAIVERRIGLDMAQPGMVRRLASAHPLPAPALLEAEAEDTPTWQSLLDSLLVPETYLFRDPSQFELMLQRGFVPGPPEPANGCTLRLWSAGCCTGEEAFTLAVLAVQALCAAGHATDGGDWFALRDDWQIDVLGTDVSGTAIERAEACVYDTGPMSPFRATQAADLRYFPPAGPASRTVRPDLRRLVRFRREGLLQSAAPVSECDVVACRNVLFYLCDAARAQALDVLSQAVRPGGLLALGPADPTPDPARFDTLWGSDAVIYRRVA